MAEEKKIAIHTFEGGMNTVVADELLAPNQARRLYNCSILSQGEGDVGIITNVKGNKQISFILPSGENKCIGVANDEPNNKFYFWIVNTNKLHAIYQYDAIGKQVTRLIENLTDTGNVDIMNLSPDFLILHADVIGGNKLNWVDGLNNARKTNIKKLLDKSLTGYGDVILQSYIDLYKQTTAFAPTAEYFSDTTKQFNRLYGALRKFAVRFIYDDNEISNWSDFSAVPLPAFEPFTGVNTIPTDNNCIKVSFETGNRTVVRIEIGMQSTSNSPNDLSILNWVSVITLDKKKLNIPSDSTYTYNFYNDGNYPVLDQAKVIQPYSFMFKRPLCQAFVKNALVQANGYEGFPVVDIDISATISYTPLFIEPGTENEFNKPQFLSSTSDADFVRGNNYITKYDGTVIFLRPIGAPSRFLKHTMTIGVDVKKGNTFQFSLTNGLSADTFSGTYTATNTDTATTVAFNIKQQLIATDRIYRKTPDIGDTNIFDNIIDGAGNVTFSYIIKANKHNDYIKPFTSVNPVQFDTLKDTGQSVSNTKLGSTIKLGIMYEDNPDGRKSLTNTVDALILEIKTINELGGFYATEITLQINHKAPKWAKSYQIVRSNDLTYGKYIQLLIQNVVAVNDDDAQDFLDLVVGSLFTYQKIHPNTPLTYEFTKGDRLRLIKDVNANTYYPVFETEIIEYNATLDDQITSNVTTNGTNTVTVGEAKSGNIGKFISIEGSEREILGAPSSTTYLLNNVIGDTEAKTYLSYRLIDRRGTIRIRKPSGFTIQDNSTVEVYTPSSLLNPLVSRQFYEFQQKYTILNIGTDEAYHSGNVQDESATQPAIVKISSGTAYVRNREMPINNQFPGTQMVIQPIEDASFSDFYPSLMNNNGRINSEDTGQGEVHFPSRMRFSNNYIQDTSINGLNDFANLDREDYNDQYGDIKLTKFDTNRILTFKELKTCFVPVDERITQANNGVALNVNSAKLLNPIQYFAWEGGIGNNPESYVSNATHKYYVSANSGVIIRLGFNGEEPISKTYFLDNEVRELITEAVKNKARIYGGFDRKNGIYVITIEGYNKYVYFDGFNGWITEFPSVPNETLFEMVTPPSHGTAILSSGFEITYTPNIDYIGTDTFSYRAFINGAWSNPKNACITIVDVPVQLAWRQKQSSFFCVLDQYGLRTGFKGWSVLEEYNIFTNEVTGNEKPNEVTDGNYVPPIVDEVTCVPQPVDPTPDPYSFAPITGAELSTEYLSEVLTLSGVNIPVTISVVDGFVSVNGGAFVNTPQTILNGQTFQVKRVSSDLYLTEVTASVTISDETEVFSITTRDESEIPIDDFDFMVLRYTWLGTAGTDLDTFTGLINTGTIYDEDWVGYSQGDTKVPAGSATPYIWWGSDNTGTGVEAILIDIKKFLEDFPSTPNPIQVQMNAVWYGTRLTGDITVGVTTYIGGTMAYDAPTFNFINTGGVEVQNISLPFNVLANNQNHVITDSSAVAILAYDKVTETATLTLQ